MAPSVCPLDAAALCHQGQPPVGVCLGVSFSSSLNVHVKTNDLSTAAAGPFLDSRALWASHPCSPHRVPAWGRGWAHLATVASLGTFAVLLTGAHHSRPACPLPSTWYRLGGARGGRHSPLAAALACLSSERTCCALCCPMVFCRARPSWAEPPGGHLLSPHPQRTAPAGLESPFRFLAMTLVGRAGQRPKK